MINSDRSCIELLNNATVFPLTFIEPAGPETRGRYDGSVHYEDGEICEIARVGLLNHEYEPKVFKKDSCQRLKGDHVFGGLLHNNHFGHFVAESLSRLWVFCLLDGQYDSVVFYCRDRNAPVSRFVTDMFHAIIPNVSLKVLNAPTEIERLIVPQELQHGSYIYGHPYNRRLFQKLRKSTELDKKVYVSRSRLRGGEGGVICDFRIDQYMASEGYKIIYPEEMTIQDQVAAYTSAEYLVFADGSALHLYALVSDPRQNVFVIWRRGKYGIFDWQTKTFGGPEIKGKSCVKKLYIKENEFPSRTHGKALLNFSLLAKNLYEHNFVSSPNWDGPSESEINLEVEKIETSNINFLVLENVE